MFKGIKRFYNSTPKNNSKIFNQIKNKKIAIHIRRNDVNKEKLPERFISIEKYDKIIDFFKNKYENYSIIIYTDSRNLEEFNCLKKYNVIINKCDLRETMHDFVKSDVFILGISALSYVPAIISEAEIYYFDNFMFNGLKNWKSLKNIIP